VKYKNVESASNIESEEIGWKPSWHSIKQKTLLIRYATNDEYIEVFLSILLQFLTYTDDWWGFRRLVSECWPIISQLSINTWFLLRYQTIGYNSSIYRSRWDFFRNRWTVLNSSIKYYDKPPLLSQRFSIVIASNRIWIGSKISRLLTTKNYSIWC
jgi:hypothetical protein